ncbi:uncharacterized protein LOC123879819 [Maniola jurtina]|uniref:uncharacterized protein LOC123879819 n=1 Tax=Maniola jurtina TaxID=191418 RepID=UPI001E68C0C7|nr:uncharacterized protein LOC123879819 [Maniola jurtina]
MSKEGYSAEKKEGDSKVVLEKLQSYLKDKRSVEVEASVIYSKPSTSFEPNPHSAVDESSNVLRDVLNHKKAELLRQPEIVSFLQTISSDLKKS